jgi:DNA-binding PadR family transcriptional regulator
MPRLTLPTASVLYAASRGLRHGFDIIDATGYPSGTVYPILRRLEESGMLRSSWEPVSVARAEQRPPRRYYQLTAAGAVAVKEALQLYPELSRKGAPAGGLRPHPA